MAAFFGKIAQVIIPILLSFVSDKIIEWFKEKKAARDKAALIKQEMKAPMELVKAAQTPEEIANAAKAVHDALASLPPK